MPLNCYDDRNDQTFTTFRISVWNFSSISALSDSSFLFLFFWYFNALTLCLTDYLRGLASGGSCECEYAFPLLLLR
ncbi:hypothetical protein M378DRAFT_596031 [Amanita muscaria Koide BX008]|uniref:Uncharacterized protein n=1 Tax=Amanita muscaria (strain Koide BX008) TaxID=946122 RepID=A0A0C2X6M3_AMAMK|nr:hypothetical protein M378DRAFT_596031 [Amanita muscaria Koide BX008]